MHGERLTSRLTPMTDYALSTDLYTYAQVSQGFFAWPSDAGEAEIIKKLSPGDVIIPKFAQSPAYGMDEKGLEWQRNYCQAIGVDYDQVRQEYEEEIGNGVRAVPFLIRVEAQADDDDRADGVPWARIKVKREDLEHPLSAAELLRLREFPARIAMQFKGIVAPGRHLQELPDGVADAVRKVTSSDDRGDHLRKYTVVEASTAEEAIDRMQAAGRTLVEGDRVFIASPAALLGVHDVTAAGELQPAGHVIPKSPDELAELFRDAALKARPSDPFRPANPLGAVNELSELFAGPNKVIAVDNFQRFHDRYVLLDRNVNQALEISKRPYVPTEQPPDVEDEEETDIEIDELAAVEGLDIEAVKKALPDYMVLPASVLKEAVTALRARKHLLLSGPPGTGKSTLAEALCAAVEIPHDVITATADWTTFDTIGGYMPSTDGLTFEPGIVLRCFQRGRWLVIDELNRADIDKAFGPLFTLLAGGSVGTPNPRVVLPYHRDGKNIEIRWAEKRTGAKGDFVLTPGWRLIGTLNIADKATLFQLSFAFLRRFAVVDVPLPDRPDYEQFFRNVCGELPETERENIIKAAMDLAFAKNRELGPAILRDVAEFVRRGLVETSSGSPTYGDAVDAFITAVRLFAVPQYEGAEATQTAAVLKILQGVWPNLADDRWDLLRQSLDSVAIT